MNNKNEYDLSVISDLISCLYDIDRDMHKPGKIVYTDLDIRKTLIKNEKFTTELRRHDIGINKFKKCGYVNFWGNRRVFVGLNVNELNVNHYEICLLEDNRIISCKELTEAERLKESASTWIDAEEFDGIPAYSVRIGKKYFYVCRNDGAYHNGSGKGIPGYATFIGKFDINGHRV